MNRISPYPLWIGHGGEGHDLSPIYDAGIEAVVELSVEEPPFSTPRDLISCRFPLIDGAGNRPEHLALAVRTVAALIASATPTLVCCDCGMSRSPAVAAVRVKQIPCVYAPVNIKDGKEGYRGWCNGMGLMKHLTRKKLDAAYEYMNWYMSGWQGAFVSRYGYYSPVPSTAKKFMTPAEYTFWYEGKPAPEPVTDPYGVPMEAAGTVRDMPWLWATITR